MQVSAMSFGFLAIATLAILVALRLRRDLLAARAEADRAEQLAAARGRSMSLAVQELRGIALAMRSAFPRALPALPADGAAQQVLRLAEDLAEVAVATPIRAIHAAPAPLGPMVDAALTTVSAQIRPGTRHWQVDPALRRLTVNADRRALQGALAALLRRAASHSRDGDVVALRWVVASETVSIVVEDEGDGLAAADLVPEAVAAPNGTRGLDLGLSLARSLAAAHGGDIRLETAPGIGARAWLTLPRERLLEAA
jgi:signal transduction histidine kinase